MRDMTTKFGSTIGAQSGDYSTSSMPGDPIARISITEGFPVIPGSTQQPSLPIGAPTCCLEVVAYEPLRRNVAGRAA